MYIVGMINRALKGGTMSDTTTITPKALADELGIDPKRLRGWLRAQHARQPEVKGTSWAIDADTADAARDRFAPKADEAEVTE